VAIEARPHKEDGLADVGAARECAARRRLVFTTLAVGLLVVVACAWATPAATAGRGGPDTCPAGRVVTHGLWHNGYSTLCGPAHVVVVTSKGTSYAIRGGFCSGGHLGFGTFGNGSAPHHGFAIVLARNRAGPVKVIDGEAEFVPGVRVALSGRAVVAHGLRTGTFKVFGRGGSTGTTRTGATFTGSWNCGAAPRRSVAIAYRGIGARWRRAAS
jgi:hypothetical protein